MKEAQEGSGVKSIVSHGATVQDGDDISGESLAAKEALPGVFCVVSWGCAATKWLAKALNAHPEVFCTHHLKFAHDLVCPTSGKLGDEECVRMLRQLGSGYAFAGDVHGISRERIPALKTVFGNEFQAVAMIRDPQKRLLSQIGLFHEYSYDERIWSGLKYLRTRPGFEHVERYFDDVQKRFFMHGVNMLNAVIEEAVVCPLVRAEDLTTDPVALGRLLRTLTGGRLEESPQWAESVIRLRAVNQHQRRDAVTIDQTWQLEILRAILSPEAVRIYGEHHYEIPETWLS
jgi:hypothetical protein